jgi:hypothetical protein
MALSGLLCQIKTRFKRDFVANPEAERRKAEPTAWAEGCPTTERKWSSADFESAVSQIFNLQAQLHDLGHVFSRLRSLSDNQQTASLRYRRLKICATHRAPICSLSSRSVSKREHLLMSEKTSRITSRKALSSELVRSGFRGHPPDPVALGDVQGGLLVFGPG